MLFKWYSVSIQRHPKTPREMSGKSRRNAREFIELLDAKLSLALLSQRYLHVDSCGE